MNACLGGSAHPDGFKPKDTALHPLISPNNTINANPGTSSLVITDYAAARAGEVDAAAAIAAGTSRSTARSAAAKGSENDATDDEKT